MRRSWTSWLSCTAALCAAAPVAGPASADAAVTTRVFAVQPKLDLAWMQSRQTYHDKLFALADGTQRGPARPLVQDGADDVASHLRADGRNLILLPEDTGLWTAFTGRRGDAARSSGSLPGAVGALLADYSPQATYYSQKYPTAAGRAPQVRLLALALTDTFGRVAVETFSEMAAKYHVWLEAGVDMAQSWQVVCSGGAHPPRQPCDEENPGKVAALGDPDEPDRGYAYEATSPDASNMALVFDPSGHLVSKQVKTYLTPIELGEAEGQSAALDLVPGSITTGLSAVPTPVGTLGFVTSKDAWMPDVVDRLEEEHVDVLVQPEFFVGDLATTTGMWAADTLKASGYNDLLRHPGFEAMALPSMVGNVFDFSADQQTQIAERPVKGGGGAWLIGQPPAPGLTGVTPWVVPDPLQRGEPFPQRRKRLGEAGKKLAPGSGAKCADPAKPAPCENGHVETVLWRDVAVGTPPFRRFRGKRLHTSFSHGRALDNGRGPERNATVAAAGRFVVVAFERTERGLDRVELAISRDGGRRWSRPAEPDARRSGDQRWPAVAVDATGRVAVAWTAGSGPTPGVLFAQARVGRSATAFSAPRPIDLEAPIGAAQWKPALAYGPGGVLHAAFVDARATSLDAGLPQAGIYYTAIGPDGQSPVVRIDQGPPDALSSKLDNSWSPALSVRGSDVFVTWLDFMHYDWDVLSRLSHDGGKTFAAQVDLNREPADVEDLSDSPRPLLTDGDPLVIWTDFHKRDSAAQTPHEMYDTYLAAPGHDPVQVDPFGAKQASTFWPSTCAVGPDAVVAFQDSSGGVARIRITRMRGHATRGRAWLVSDTRANAYRPAIACTRGRVVAAWEDARTGPTRIYTAAAPLKKLR
ncbi:MAG: hypothetical protein ACJ76Z_03975 [Thermoleophilaceae bacterium]